MKRIAIEEHFSLNTYLDYLRSRKEYPRVESGEDQDHNKVDFMVRSPVSRHKFSPDYLRRITDLGQGRLAEMDKNGITMQVLCQAAPGVDELDVPSGTRMAKKVNDELAEVAKKHPDRFAGFAAIAPGDPGEAARELERAVKQLGLKGGKVNSHGGKEFLDDRKYWVIFEKAQELGVPIYLHPGGPSKDIIEPFKTYPILATAMWGFAVDAGLHAMRLICSGVFDVFPGLNIILGHLGEAIPFWLWRIDNHWKDDPIARKLKRKPSEYFKNNFYVTTSGVYNEPPFLCTYLMLGADRILFAVDYPYESNDVAVKFMDNVPISDMDREKIYHLNVERLLKI